MSRTNWIACVAAVCVASVALTGTLGARSSADPDLDQLGVRYPAIPPAVP